MIMVGGGYMNLIPQAGILSLIDNMILCGEAMNGEWKNLIVLTFMAESQLPMANFMLKIE